MHCKKSELSEIFIKKLVEELNRTKNWSVSRLCVLNSEKDDGRVVLNEFSSPTEQRPYWYETKV